MCGITLFQYNSPEISINITAFFNGEKLVIEGYDIGKRVKETLGDSDYEYVTTVPEESVNKLYSLMKVNIGDKYKLLEAIAKIYNTNTCYSEFREFLDKNEIKYEGFSWA
jgi:hypothetical protein